VGDVRGELHLRRHVVYRPASALAGELEPSVIVALWHRGYRFDAYGKPHDWPRVAITPRTEQD
jgi:hypothetical protein